MSESKETKALIKEIRESIKAKNFGDAIHKCQRLLKSDSQNHMVYLLLGAAYQSNDKVEAAKSLRKAIQYSPGPPTVAWQGLATCAPNEELPEVYEKLLEYIPEKENEYLEKLMNIARHETIAGDCFRVIKKFVKQQRSINNSTALESLAKLWYKHDFPVEDDDRKLYKLAMELLIDKTDNLQQIGIFKRYLKWLYKQNDYADCIRNACKMIQVQPNDVYGYEWICKIFCENQENTELNEWRELLQAPIETYVEQLSELDKDSGLARLIKAFDLYEKEEYVLVRDSLRYVRQLLPNYMVATVLLARTEMKLGAYRLALILWELLESRDQAAYAQCLSHENDPEQLKKAIELLEKSSFDDDENIKALARCYYKLNDKEHLVALNLNNLVKAEFLMNPSDALTFIETIPETDTFEALLLRGKLNLVLGNTNDALTHILKATRLKPYFTECFEYLGRIYMKSNDLVRARKCYEKCLNLNVICEKAVDDLSGLYRQLGEEDLNEALLLNTLPYLRNDDAMNVHYKLGLHFLKVKKWDNAIQSFRTSIKYDVKCMIFWESLGDAYVARGSYNSAIRVFTKILEMSSENIYAQLQIAVIKMTIRMYPEAIEDFEALLNQHPDYLPGMKGIAEAHLGLAINYKSSNLYGRAKDHLQKATNYLQSIILKGVANEMIWLWRLTANIFVHTAQLPTSLANLDVAGILAKREDPVAFLMRKDLLHLAMRFYTCALKLQENTYLWYELALCCYYSANYIPEEVQLHLELAEKAIKMAIKQQSNRWHNWNLLGVINMHSLINNLPLAQHCFIQALNLERKSFTSWSNLGALYLKLNEIKLANQAFQRAQQSNPIYANAWIGQAMIAEAINEEDEAMDLFRHCQQFDYHPESSLGYAYWICHMMSSPALCALPQNRHAIERMYADTVALDAINWYIRNEELDASIPALTFQAFLYANKKLYRSALKPLLQATKMSPPGADRDKLYTNLGYLYLQLKEPEQAINAFNNVSHVTFKPIIGLALAYYRAGHLQESYSVYNSVLSSIESDSEDTKSANILVAMASMVYAYQGDIDTKTILYQCILLRDPPVQALYSACALGILHQDKELTGSILHELQAYAHQEKYCIDISYLTAQYYLVQKQPSEALAYLLSRVRMFPLCAALRKLVAELLLDMHAGKSKYRSLTSQMALGALLLLHRKPTKRTNSRDYVETLLSVTRALKPLDPGSAQKYIQSAMHLQPQNRQVWSDLALS